VCQTKKGSVPNGILPDADHQGDVIELGSVADELMDAVENGREGWHSWYGDKAHPERSSHSQKVGGIETQAASRRLVVHIMLLKWVKLLSV